MINNLLMNILAIGDTADNIASLKKFTKKAKIHLINFPRKQAGIVTNSSEGIEFFDSLLISKQVEKIIKIKDKFDLCIVMSWSGARIAYLAGINYIMYFVGDDIKIAPFIKNPKISYLKNIIRKRNFLERFFYRKVFDNALACIAPFEEYYEPLSRYRKDAIRLDRMMVDTEIFNEFVKPIDLPKEKFTLLSAQRIGLEKGFDKIWQALDLCQTDFEVLQVNWFIERTDEEKRFNEELMKKLPKQIKLIPLIKRDQLASYFMYADAILGQMRSGIQSGIERDAAFCRKPVLCFTDTHRPTLIDGEKIIAPFLPTSSEPKEIALLIDRVVSSKEFRETLANHEYEYVKKLSDPDKVVNDWESIFKNSIEKCKSINRKNSGIKLKIDKKVVEILEKIIYVRIMKKRNIEGWGMEEYFKLMKS